MKGIIKLPKLFNGQGCKVGKTDLKYSITTNWNHLSQLLFVFQWAYNVGLFDFNINFKAQSIYLPKKKPFLTHSFGFVWKIKKKNKTQLNNFGEASMIHYIYRFE